MSSAKTILVVDDNIVNRKMLKKILSEDYSVVLASNGYEALKFVEDEKVQISGIMLDLIMPFMDGYEFLNIISSTPEYSNIPIIVTTASFDRENEIKALEMGAWDFVSKPYDAKIIKFRLKNAIDRSQLSALKKLKYLAEYDSLTGIFNKPKFLTTTRKILSENKDEKFALVSFDIDKFSLINAYLGIAEGDRLLKYIAEKLSLLVSGVPNSTFARIEADEFAFCIPYSDRENINSIVEKMREHAGKFNLSFDVVFTFGVYEISDINISVNTMLDYARLAAKQVKGKYMDCCAFYSEDISLKLDAEQQIVNEMSYALENEQFCIYFQPKYSLKSNLPVGAEALVRWNHPTKGIISPGAFIPVFERNGFIIKLDYFVWESVCKVLKSWIDRGIEPHPISVNVSRVNLYNTNLVESLCELTNRYKIPKHLFNLELTESAYTDNPQVIKQIMQQLSAKGFAIYMDDFGSGYSSLNILKDIEIDVLKIDMEFLSESEIPGRGENILASVVRMAKWLHIPTIAEGVEKIQQVEFLHSIGCEFVQGYYFAKPLTLDKYEILMEKSETFVYKTKRNFDVNSLWASTPQMDILFSSMTQAVGIYEFENNHIELLRVNRAYYDLFGYEDLEIHNNNPTFVVKREYLEGVMSAFRSVCASKKTTECEYVRICVDKSEKWIRMNLKFIDKIDERNIILCTLLDISAQKEIDLELKKYKLAINKAEGPDNRILIVDDHEMNRDILKEIFAPYYEVMSACNGKEAIDLLDSVNNNVEIVLLDLMMPVMNGNEFLEYKKQHEEISDIPVIIITADDSPRQQINTLKLGADDYVVKPFVKEIVLRRVKNVIDSHKRFRQILHEYMNVMGQAQTDSLTGIHNRGAARDVIEKVLHTQPNHTHAFIMVDVDKFKDINDGYGHDCGDKILIAIAEKIKGFFREGDITARLGGDEFCVFLPSISCEETVVRKCEELCREINNMFIDGLELKTSISVGIAISSPEENDFDTLYKNADIALYESKKSGRNRVGLFGSTVQKSKVDAVINKEWILNSLEDIIYLIDYDTYDLIYSDNSNKEDNIPQVKNKKCYEAFYGRNEPCENCIQKFLSYDKFYQWKYCDASLNKNYIVKDKLVLFDGRKMHLQLSVDISDTAEYGPIDKIEKV